MRFDILNCLGVDLDWDGQTDGQTELALAIVQSSDTRKKPVKISGNVH